MTSTAGCISRRELVNWNGDQRQHHWCRRAPQSAWANLMNVNGSVIEPQRAEASAARIDRQQVQALPGLTSPATASSSTCRPETSSPSSTRTPEPSWPGSCSQPGTAAHGLILDPAGTRAFVACDGNAQLVVPT